MPLLGLPLMLTLTLLLVLATAALLTLWSRVRGATAARVAQRLGLLVVVQLTTVLLVAAGVNNWGYFYGSWSDLFGNGGRTNDVAASTDPSKAPLTAYRPEAGAPHASAPVALDWSTPAQYSTRGEVLKMTIPGARTGLSSEALVYLPPQYFLRINKHRLFPGVEAMTGYPGSTMSLLARFDYPGVLLHAMADHTAGPMILVMLDPAVDPPRDTECTNIPAGPQTLTYLTQDVPTYLEGRYRIRTAGWGAMGHSTGGYCATKMALTSSNVFRAVVAMSGYYHPLSDVTTGSLWGGSSVVENLNNPEWLLAHQPAPPIDLLATVGTAERGANGISDTRKFLALVRSPMTAQEVIVNGGGHNFTDWASVMPRGMAFLWQHLHG